MALDFSASIAYKCYRDRLRYVCRGCELHHITDAAQFGATDGESRLLHLIRAVRYCNVVILQLCTMCDLLLLQTQYYEWQKAARSMRDLVPELTFAVEKFSRHGKP